MENRLFQTKYVPNLMRLEVFNCSDAFFEVGFEFGDEAIGWRFAMLSGCSVGHRRLS